MRGLSEISFLFVSTRESTSWFVAAFAYGVALVFPRSRWAVTFKSAVALCVIGWLLRWSSGSLARQPLQVGRNLDRRVATVAQHGSRHQIHEARLCAGLAMCPHSHMRCLC